MDDSERSYGFSRDLYHGAQGVGGHYQETGNTHFDRSYEYGAEGEPGNDVDLSPEEAAMHVIDGTTLRTESAEPQGQNYDYDRASNYGQVESFTWDLDGPHRGRGPQGYQRADERIHEEVCQILTDHGAIDASGIEVKVENGEVTLSGKAPDRRTKRLAEAVSETVRGVTDVHNRLRLG